MKRSINILLAILLPGIALALGYILTSNLNVDAETGVHRPDDRWVAVDSQWRDLGIWPDVETGDDWPIPLNGMVYPDRPTVVFVLSGGDCPDCTELLDEWHLYMPPSSTIPYNLIMAADELMDSTGPGEVLWQAQSIHVVSMPNPYEVGVRLFPTLFLLDADRRISAIQIGWGGMIKESIRTTLRRDVPWD